MSRNLALRLGTAAVLIPTVLGLVWLGGWWMRGLVFAIAAVSLGELFWSMRRVGLTPPWPAGFFSGLAVVTLPNFVPGPVLVAGVFALCLVWGLLSGGLARVGVAFATAFGTLYVAIPLAIGPAVRELPDRGWEWAAVTLACVWICDSGAYFVGRAMGRHKLLPQVSPRKTWEGLLGGVVSATMAASVLALAFGMSITTVTWAGFCLGVATTAGDLIESAIKRGLGVKDMGSLLPGHGGLLDRIDGLLAAIPIGYLCAWLAQP